MLEGIRAVATDRERMKKESLYSPSKLGNRLAEKDKELR